MVIFQSIIRDLQDLPAPILLKAAQYIHQLNPRRLTKQDRLAALRSSAGGISKEDADIMERSIKESDQIIDEFNGSNTW
ncbi:MAG: hypothetical protein K2W99_00035 [Chthoniobacterales bacterium]|nr:hypothetical protein [Chthoniobacterales bacterium]